MKNVFIFPVVPQTVEALEDNLLEYEKKISKPLFVFSSLFRIDTVCLFSNVYICTVVLMFSIHVCMCIIYTYTLYIGLIILNFFTDGMHKECRGC